MVSDDEDDDLTPAVPVSADAAGTDRREPTVVDTKVLDGLRAVAEQVAVTQRIAQRTVDRAALEAMERMADTGVGMVVHPATIRTRATAVVDARTSLAQADQLVEAHDAAAAEEAALPPPPPPPPPVAPVTAPPRTRGFLELLRRGRAPRVEDTAESTERLRAIAAATDDVFGARRASAAREDQRALLVVRRDSIHEVVRVAEHAWYDVAGEGAEPTNVEAVVRRLDPQHQDALLAAQEMVSVRAASKVFDEAMARWEASWADLGMDAPLPGDAEAAIERLASEAAGAGAPVGPAAERAIDLTEAAPPAVVVDLDGSHLTDA